MMFQASGTHSQLQHVTRLIKELELKASKLRIEVRFLMYHGSGHGRRRPRAAGSGSYCPLALPSAVAACDSCQWLLRYSLLHFKMNTIAVCINNFKFSFNLKMPQPGSPASTGLAQFKLPVE